MTVIIDRRKNVSEKSVANRQRFLKRSQQAIKKALERNMKTKSIGDVLDGDTVSIPSKDLSEPIITHSGTKGQHDYIYPGNDVYNEGDLIEKPSGGPGNGPGQESGGPADYEDAFTFTLTKEEFLDFFFEPLELPDLVEKELRSVSSFTMHRAGYTKTGSPANINIEQSMMKSFGRKIALHRPSDKEIEELEEELGDRKALSCTGMHGNITREELNENDDRITFLIEEIERLKARQRQVPFIDDMDIRYNHFMPHPDPATRAVMFCCMDVSGSMGEFEKNIAKRFFMLLYYFLEKNYGLDNVELVFIRHTTDAQEVDEHTFFYDPHSGGTLVSSALEEMMRIIKARYPTSDWNIYGAQVSDGDNDSRDNVLCKKILEEQILPITQYFAYIQVDSTDQSSIASRAMAAALGFKLQGLWPTYESIKSSNFAIRSVKAINEIWTVFSDLFKKRQGFVK